VNKQNKEGLKNLSLLMKMLDHPAIKLTPRLVDANWVYEKIIPHALGGFNPFLRKVFTPYNSMLKQWVDNGCKDDRQFNENDRLVNEALFFMHDFVHNWAVHAIQILAPDVGFGKTKITQDNFEDMCFCYLLTEAAATVGIDYWYLSTLDLGQTIGLGSNHTSLTVSYHENDLQEYQRFDQEFNVQAPGFFHKIACFYNTGDFDGFDIKDLKRSPKLLGWLKHELEYGQTQRRYTRLWFSYLSFESMSLNKDQLKADIKICKPWQKQLILDLQAQLWTLIKTEDFSLLDKGSISDPTMSMSWANVNPDQYDFRFFNLNSSEHKFKGCLADGKGFISESKKELMYQYISRLRYDDVPFELLGVINLILKQGGISGLHALIKNMPENAISSQKYEEPEHVFFLP